MMKNSHRLWLWLCLPLMLMLSSCLGAGMMTENIIDQEMSNLTPGQTKDQMLKQFGLPHFMATIPVGQDVVEIWGYQMGNFTHQEEGMLMFKNERLFAVPRTSSELLKYMYMARVINQAEFHNPLGDSRQNPK